MDELSRQEQIALYFAIAAGLLVLWEGINRYRRPVTMSDIALYIAIIAAVAVFWNWLKG